MKNGDDKNKISFSSKLNQSLFGEFIVYEFTEPSNNVMNRIEYTDKDVNIFAGPSTINLSLKKRVGIEYNTPHGVLILHSYLEKLDKLENGVYFEYTLSNNDEEIGKYKITLEVSDEKNN
ncbi:MAG: DUF1934 family protein [Mycoplasma sp.]|nr:DUF1934 family protein [Mycoplasma sp.]